MFRYLILACSLFGLFCSGMAHAQKMPREDVVEVPAIGTGLCVSNVFQTNMVLQRDKPLKVWGWADPSEKVTVSFAGQVVDAAAESDRSWQVTLEPMSANNRPQVMTIKGKSKTLDLENILVGDVWVLGGQSNMEFDISKVDDGPLEIISANFPQIRLLTMPRGKGFDSVKSFQRLHEWSDWSSRHFRKGDWEICTPETVREFAAIGYIFGRRLQMASQIPIGLIDTSIGGTTVETWTPEAVVKSIEEPETREKLDEWQEKIDTYDAQKELQRRIDNYQRKKVQLAEQGKPMPPDSKPPSDLRPGPLADKNRPGYCYAGVIKPLEGLAIKGAVFHQGFNNCFGGSAGARMYYQVFGKMITSWRKAFDDEQMPFCIISLCTAGEPQTMENFVKPMMDIGAMIREAQYQAFRDLHDAGDENIGFVSCFDLRRSWYHPQVKIPAGERAAKWALVTQYELLQGGDARQYWLPPSIEEVQIIDGTIRLTMSDVIKTRDESDGKMLGFAIAGEDRRFCPADIQYYTDGTVDSRNRPQYKRDMLVLSSPFVPKPVHYRYAWARNPMTNLVNNLGVALATQRSDDWLPEETPIKFLLPPGATIKTHGRWIRDRINKELGFADTQRQIQEAEATITRLKEKYVEDKEAWEEQKATERQRAEEAGKGG